MERSDICIYRDLNDLSSLSEIIKNSEYNYECEVLIEEVVELNKYVSSQLELPIAARAVHLERLWKIEKRPFAIERQYINVNLWNDFDENTSFNNELMKIVTSDNFIKAFSREEEIKIVQSINEESIPLNIENGTDLLLVKGRSFNIDSIPFQYYEIVNIPKYVKYRSYRSYETE